MAGPTPIVRQMVVCEHATFSFPTGYTLVNPRVDFIVAPGVQFPVYYPELWLFSQFGGSYGPHRFRIKMVDVTDPTIAAVIVFETSERAVHLGRPRGKYRLQSRSWASRLSNLPFARVGRYELWVTFDDIPAGRIE